MSLVYYRKERERHPAAFEARIGPDEAGLMLRRLVTYFQTGPVTLYFRGRRGGGHYEPVAKRIRLGWRYVEGAWAFSQGTLYHEFAHHLEHERRVDGQKRRAHGRHHTKQMDRVVAFATKEGWLDGAVSRDLQARAVVVEERKRIAAAPPSLEDRIAHKMLLMAKLATGIKRKQTQISKHRRSIAALRRSAAKTEGKGEVE